MRDPQRAGLLDPPRAEAAARVERLGGLGKDGELASAQGWPGAVFEKATKGYFGDTVQPGSVQPVESLLR